MADFQILNVRALNGHLVIEAEHFNPDGSHWFFEEYLFQGREAFKHKRIADDDGFPLLKRTDSDAAPIGTDDPSGARAARVADSNGTVEAVLSASREWLRDETQPHLRESSVLKVIAEEHRLPHTQGYDGRIEGAKRLTPSADDLAGASQLRAAFMSLSRRTSS